MPTHPIRALRASSFGAFAHVDLEFASGLNVIVGDNGAGKSQLLKVLYACTATLEESRDGALSKTTLSRTLASKLVGTFKPESLGRLANRQRGRARAEVRLKLGGLKEHLAFSFATNSRSEVVVASAPTRSLEDTPVFLPSRELLSIYPGFVSMYNERLLEFDETWKDTADLLGRPPLRGPRSEAARELLAPIENLLDGRVSEVGGRFYLEQRGLGNLEMHLVAEGQRKLAMIVRLVQSGTLLQRGYLFWDEPEANLNPSTLRAVAKVIDSLARSGVQVFVATHSVFLLRELSLLGASSGASDYMITGLARGPEGVVAAQAGSIQDLDLSYIRALEAEFEQADRYLTSDSSAI